MFQPSTEAGERSGPQQLPEMRRLRLLERLRLASEILRAYLAARSALRGSPIEQAVGRLREGERSELDEAGADGTRALNEARRLGVAVVRTLALLPGDSRCLVRSLVMTRLLARRGIPATLVIGARVAPEFLAHAWVECAGGTVLDPGDGSFGRLVEL